MPTMNYFSTNSVSAFVRKMLVSRSGIAAAQYSFVLGGIAIIASSSFVTVADKSEQVVDHSKAEIQEYVDQMHADLTATVFVSKFSDVAVQANNSYGPIEFEIWADGAQNLTVSTNSSNATLVPNENIQISGSGQMRTLIVVPAEGQTGSAHISVSVQGDAQTVTESFDILVGEDS